MADIIEVTLGTAQVDLSVEMKDNGTPTVQTEIPYDVIQGAAGKSAYQIAVQNGFTGTVEEWLLSLKGADGIDGTDGKDGINGSDGRDGRDGTDGSDGKSAYQIASEHGFVGTVTEWIESLKGADGKDGKDGSDGKDGVNGINGKDGSDGLSAYELAVESGFSGTIDEWLLSLKGKDGEPGKSLVFDDLTPSQKEELRGEQGPVGPQGKDYVLTEADKAEIASTVIPTSGLPKDKLSQDVQTSLGKADTALQEHQSLEGLLPLTGGVLTGNLSLSGVTHSVSTTRKLLFKQEDDSSTNDVSIGATSTPEMVIALNDVSYYAAGKYSFNPCTGRELTLGRLERVWNGVYSKAYYDADGVELANKYQPKGNYLTEHQSLTGYVPKSGGEMSVNATLKFNMYGNRYLTISGNNISLDLSTVVGGWAGSLYYLKDSTGKGYTALGYHGGELGLNHFYMGGTYLVPDVKIVPSKYDDDSNKVFQGYMDAVDLRKGGKAVATESWVNGKGYLTEHQSLAGLQPTIADLESIRVGAQAGATALQPDAIADMETMTHAGATYQLKGDYLTEHNVFYAEYGVATYQQVLDAVDAGKIVFTKTTINSSLRVLVYVSNYNSTQHYFYCVYGSTDTDGVRAYACCSNKDVWSKGSVATDSYTKTQADGRYLQLTGGTLTGSLVLPKSTTTSAFNDKSLLFGDSARIGVSSVNSLGLYATGTNIYIRPSCSATSASAYGLSITKDNFTYNGNEVATQDWVEGKNFLTEQSLDGYAKESYVDSKIGDISSALTQILGHE